MGLYLSLAQISGRYCARRRLHAAVRPLSYHAVAGTRIEGGGHLDREAFWWISDWC
jgi:hypothetical protein